MYPQGRNRRIWNALLPTPKTFAKEPDADKSATVLADNERTSKSHPIAPNY